MNSFVSHLVACGFLLAAASPQAEAADAALGWEGAAGASWHWTLPETPNGLKPDQSWHAVASAPDGDIYIAGMDHKTDSALYRIDQASGRMEYMGDARAASEAAGNWRPGETVEKFHTRPLWHNGKTYVATMNRSSLDDAYLQVRGFHWYALDPKRRVFEDASAAQPGGVGAEHGNIVATASNPARNVIYGASVPNAEIFRFDVAAGHTQNLGRPASFDQPYPYTGRVMWVDSRGRLYFTAGNVRLGAQNPSVFAHVHYYDPESGFGERKDWALHEPRALEAGQCVDGGKRCYFTDDSGHLYRFDDDGPQWREIGQMQLNEPWGFVWMFQVSPDERTIYAANSIAKGKAGLFAYDVKTGRTRRMCSVADLDPALKGLEFNTGMNAWDAKGRFYFTSFGDGGKLIVNRVDPALLDRCARGAERR